MKPSLTPNADAVNQAIEQLRIQLTPTMAEAGEFAAITRITFAVCSAACLALAQEGDLRTRRSVMAEGIINAVTNVIVQSALTLSDDGEGPVAMIGMLTRVTDNVANQVKGDCPPSVGVAVHVQPVGEA